MLITTDYTAPAEFQSAARNFGFPQLTGLPRDLFLSLGLFQSAARIFERPTALRCGAHCDAVQHL